jgi:soluble lytic murein transglycosylase
LLHRDTLRLACLYLCCLTGLAAVAQPLQDPEALRFREQFGEARQAIDRGAWTEYSRLRSRLDDYPLALYLDYFRLRAGRGEVAVTDVQRFLARSEDSPLALRFLDAYLQRAGRQRRWLDFLAVMPEPPNDIVLQCYYYRAHLAAGSAPRAWQGAADLWVHGRSRPEACDPLFEAWIDSGGLQDSHVWARLKLVFAAGQSSLLGYVSRFASEDLQPWADRLRRVYERPDRALSLLRTELDSPFARDSLHLALRRLAVYNSAQALEHWLSVESLLREDTAEATRTEKRIAFRSLLDTREDAVPWLSANLLRWGDDQLTEMRLRWLLAEQDWPAVLATLPALSEEEQASSRWLYWRARAGRQVKGSGEERLLERAAGQRNYYGFLAADLIGQPYVFNQREPGPLADMQSLTSLPGTRRVRELQALTEDWLAHSEWRHLIAQREAGERLDLAQWAAGEGWYHLAIDAANSAEASDALSLRFPAAYRELFDTEAAALGLTATELQSIARRESAFFANARSAADARGLMQLLPRTGQSVARTLGLGANPPLFDAPTNVRLGSAYYAQLLERFHGNRPLALAAYNAGPGRADAWRNDSGERVPVDIWIETIPYRETREYVQAVLAYNVVFAYLRGDRVELLRAGERGMLY